MQYHITYEKRDADPLLSGPALSHVTIEARNMVDATMKALINADKNDRVRAVEGPPA